MQHNDHDSLSQKFKTALFGFGRGTWIFLTAGFRRRNPTPTIPAKASPEPSLTPLERIKAHLCHLGLSQQVRVRFEAADGDFILEDDDGVVHAKNYAAAVAIIERTWL